jgi:hypothetical protein
MIGISVCPTLGLGTTAIGDTSTSPSSTSQAKNCCNDLCLFNAVAADRDSTIHAWNETSCFLVTDAGSPAPPEPGSSSLR